MLQKTHRYEFMIDQTISFTLMLELQRGIFGFESFLPSSAVITLMHIQGRVRNKLVYRSIFVEVCCDLSNRHDDFRARRLTSSVEEVEDHRERWHVINLITISFNNIRNYLAQEMWLETPKFETNSLICLSIVNSVMHDWGV